MERRMALLEDEFDKIEGKTDHAQESKFSKLDDVLAKVGGASASLLPTGVRVSLTTAIKVVVALLQHTTTVRRPAPRTSPAGPLACSLFVLVLAVISHPPHASHPHASIPACVDVPIEQPGAVRHDHGHLVGRAQAALPARVERELHRLPPGHVHVSPFAKRVSFIT